MRHLGKFGSVPKNSKMMMRGIAAEGALLCISASLLKSPWL